MSAATPSLRMAGGVNRREESPPSPSNDLLGVSGLVSTEVEWALPALILVEAARFTEEAADGGQLEAKLFLAPPRLTDDDDGDAFSFSNIELLW